jgi:SnoaL-like domain
MARTGESSADTAVQAARRFIEGLNARDADALRADATVEVELRMPHGKPLRGHEGLDDLVKVAADAGILLARAGSEETEADADITRVTVPVREFVRRRELPGTATFEVRDGRVAAFSVALAG